VDTPIGTVRPASASALASVAQGRAERPLVHAICEVQLGELESARRREKALARIVQFGRGAIVILVVVSHPYREWGRVVGDGETERAPYRVVAGDFACRIRDLCAQALHRGLAYLMLSFMRPPSETAFIRLFSSAALKSSVHKQTTRYESNGSWMPISITS
jgi:hypothetical protein